MLAVGMIWLALAGGVHATTGRAAFTVSVQVVAHCNLDDSSALLQADRLALTCTRGTGYQILVDGQPAAAGADGGIPRILPLSGTGRAARNPTRVAGRHWITILY